MDRNSCENFKVLEVENGCEYRFSTIAFKRAVRKYQDANKSNGKRLTKKMVFEQLSQNLHYTKGSVENWMYEKNGPGNLDTVKLMAEFLHVDYKELLVKKEKEIMEEMNQTEQNVVMNMEKTKDVIRAVYQKMAVFMDAAARELCFDRSEEVYYKYDALYKDMEATLHKSMLDIPIGIYDQLNGILEEDLHMYMYGVPEFAMDIWDFSDFEDFCEEEHLEGDVAKYFYMQKKSADFYAGMREILKDYMLA